MPALSLRGLALLCALLLAFAAAADERRLYTLSLRHTLPEQVLPALAAQLSADSSINAYRQQLILNATAAEYRQISALLEQLDQAPHSLLISVRGQGQQFEQREQYGADGRIGSGNVQVQSGPGGHYQRRTETRVTVNQSTRQGSSDGTQQVRAVEGMAAFISAGATYPLRSGNYGERQLTPVTSGFYATARILDGDEVLVDIDQHDDRMAGGTVETQSLQTQVRGRLGEWIDLGSIGGTSSDSERGLTRYGNRNTSTLTGISIRVERAP